MRYECFSAIAVLLVEGLVDRFAPFSCHGIVLTKVRATQLSIPAVVQSLQCIVIV